MWLLIIAKHNTYILLNILCIYIYVCARTCFTQLVCKWVAATDSSEFFKEICLHFISFLHAEMTCAEYLSNIGNTIVVNYMVTLGDRPQASMKCIAWICQEYSPHGKDMLIPGLHLSIGLEMAFFGVKATNHSPNVPLYIYDPNK